MYRRTEGAQYGGGGGYRGRGGGGRGGGYRGGRGGGGGDGWGASWSDAQAAQPAAVWGEGVAPGGLDNERVRRPRTPPTGQSMSDADAANWFKENNGANYIRLKEFTGALITGAGGRAAVYVRHVQSDPFAPGSQMTVRITYDGTRYHHNKAIRRVALEDLIHRHFHRVVSLDPQIEMLKPSQHVIERSSVRCVDGAVELHVRCKLPGQGRRIDGRACASILQRLMAAGLGIDNLRSPDIFRHLDSVEDQEWLRGQLSANGLVGFVPNDANLPRSSGKLDTPLLHQNVPFVSPAEHAVSFTLPCRGTTITGMGIKKGITVIIGGGFHGKSTLLRALEVGVYNKIPGDGREYVVVDPMAVKIRAEDRRSITEVNISPFINNIPMGRSTTNFSTPDASGSTSQAANIVEALELGSSTLLVDEDTSATNFMSRDSAMKALVPDALEPITPLVDRIRQLSDVKGVSVILVAGGSSAFLAAADTVLQLQSYKVVDLTERAKGLSLPPPQSPAGPAPSFESGRLVDVPTTMRGLDAERLRCSAQSIAAIRMGEELIDVDKVEQLVEVGQGNGIAMCLAWMHNNLKGEVGVNECIDRALEAVSAHHLEVPTTTYYAPMGFVTMPRKLEVGAALNRLRSLAIKGLSK